MTENESVRFMLRLVQEKHQLLKNRLGDLFQTMPLDKHEEKVDKNRMLLQASQDLSLILSASDRPRWLEILINETSLYEKNHNVHNVGGYNFRLLHAIVEHKNMRYLIHGHLKNQA